MNELIANSDIHGIDMKNVSLVHYKKNKQETPSVVEFSNSINR